MATSDIFLNVVKSIPVDEIQSWHKVALNYGIIDIALHPYDYADTLIRLGYEPFPPWQVSPIFYSPSLVLPGISTYVYYIYSIEGFTGIFRTVLPYVASSLIYRHLNTYLVNLSPIPSEHPQNEPRLSSQFTTGNLSHFVRTRTWKMLSSIAALHVSYPIYVVAVRSMARFVTSSVTKEGYRPPIIQSWFNELFKITTISELYAGLQARMLREFAFTVVSGGVFLVLMKLLHYVQSDPQQAIPLERSIDYLGNSVATMYTTYCRNVADIMIINGTDIPLGNPPFIEKFSGCWDCLFRLNTFRRWKTSGGTPFGGRPYHGPMEVINGMLFPTEALFGPIYLPWDARSYEDTPYFLSDYYAIWRQMGVSPGADVRALNEVFKRKVGSALNETSPKGASGQKPSPPSTGNLMSSVFIGMSNPFKL